MPTPMFPRDWYWIADDGRVYTPARQSIVKKTDADYKTWLAAGNLPTRWPVDEAGKQTDAALQEVLTPYGLSVGVDAARASAKQQLSTLLDAAASTLTTAPLAEQLSWPIKQDAARAFLAGTATDEQKALLQAEADITDETLADLCNVVLESAVAFSTATGKIAGLRREVSKAIDACNTVKCVADALASATETIKGALSA